MTLTQPRHLQFSIPLEAIAGICTRWSIVRLEVFGSALSPEFSSESDLDLLYTFDPHAHVGLKIVELADELEALIGRKVDLVSRQAVERSANPYRKNRILGSAQVIYER